MKAAAWVLACSALGGCAVWRTPHQPIGTWAAVQWLPAGTEVVVLADGIKHTGTLEDISADSIVVREETGRISIERSDVLRVSRRETCRRQRRSNTVIEGTVFSLAAAMLLPFHHGNDAKLFGVMAASGVALGATARTTTYRESDVYVRRRP